MNIFEVRVIILSTSILLSGCTTPYLGDRYYVQHAQTTWQNPVHHYGQAKYSFVPERSESLSDNKTQPRWTVDTPPLSPGDRLKVTLRNGEEYSGVYEVDIDGYLKLPFLQPLPVAGELVSEAKRLITQALIKSKYFKSTQITLSVDVQQWAPIQVHVSGAVFNPGMVSVNVRSPEERLLKSQHNSGDFPPDRLLPAALRAAGGVRPDAAIHSIELKRNGKTQAVDLSGLIKGNSVAPIALMSGDTIIVYSTGRFDSNLVAPTAITPQGVRVFLSNLVVPAPGNAAAAVEKHATSLPYGSRLLTAAISANCVGGINMTSGSRHTVLVRTDPISGREETIKRPIHDLLRSPDRNDINPYIMPNDGVACYDSGVSNFRDMARTLGDFLLPLTLLLLL